MCFRIAYVVYAISEFQILRVVSPWQHAVQENRYRNKKLILKSAYQQQIFCWTFLVSSSSLGEDVDYKITNRSRLFSLPRHGSTQKATKRIVTSLWYTTALTVGVGISWSSRIAISFKIYWSRNRTKCYMHSLLDAYDSKIDLSNMEQIAASRLLTIGK